MDEVSLDLQVDDWLEVVRISALSEWDVLIFLSRHGASLVSAGQLATLMGYSRGAMGKALESLGSLGLVQRSRSSQGVRLYQFALPANSFYQHNLKQLMVLSEKRGGRLVMARRFRERARQMHASTHTGLHFA